MSLINEYKSSLKSYDVEEILDLAFFRPLSFLLVKLIYPTNITPNQISVVSMLFGLMSGVMFSFGTHKFFVLGAVMILVSNILDCADGQLARLKQNGTKIGRIIDGFIDYVTGFSIFAGLGIGLSVMTGEVFYVWVLVVIAAGSRVLQNMYFDYYRLVYLKKVYNKGTDVQKEIEEFKKFREVLNRTKGRYGEKFLVYIYIKYSSVQKTSTNTDMFTVDPEEYKKRNVFILRLWSWLGSTTHLSAVILFLFINRVDIYLWVTVIAGNIALVILYFWQKRIISEISVKQS